MNNYCVTIFRVRYAETDQMGIAHHSNYFIWFEAGRSDLCRSWGIPYGQWEASGVMLPLVEARCRYKRPFRYDEEVRMESQVLEVKKPSITFRYRLLDASGALHAEGVTRHAFTALDGKLIRGDHPFLSPLFEQLKELRLG